MNLLGIRTGENSLIFSSIFDLNGGDSTIANIVSALELASNRHIPTFSIFGEKGKAIAAKSTHSIILDSTDYQIVENA